jgi:PPOX class probable F420-dependent enzyme
MTTDAEHVLPDPSTPYGEAVRRRLREEQAIWLTTVSPSGVPQPNPVWFLWQEDEGDEWGDGSFLIYHDNTAARLKTLVERPTVSLHFDGSEYLEVTVFLGEVEVLKDAPPAHEIPEYVAKYAEHVEKITKGAQSLEEFMARYSVASRVRPTRVRGF